MTLDSSKGTGHFTRVQTGDFVLVPDAPTQPTYIGNFTVRSGESITFTNFMETEKVTLQGTGSDRSVLRIHLDTHTTINSNSVTVSFDHLRLRGSS